MKVKLSAKILHQESIVFYHANSFLDSPQITNLSKQFVHWDEVVTGIEAAKQTQSLQDWMS